MSGTPPSFDICQFVWLFGINKQVFKYMCEWANDNSPILIRTLGVLFRQQFVYLMRPLVANLEMLRSSSRKDVACWSWSVWLQLAGFAQWLHDRGEALPRQTPKGPFRPHCWACSAPTLRKCPACSDFMISCEMQEVPACSRCAVCLMCFNHGVQEEHHMHRFRFSYRFRRECPQFAQ